MGSALVPVLRRFIRRFVPRRPPTEPAGPRQAWSIGIYTGSSPFEFVPAADVPNPVLAPAHISDVPAVLVADPFMVRVEGTWYMFFEVMNEACGKGEIGLAVSEDALTWTYRRIVLSEPFHLSYPYVFEWNGDYYMTPETGEAGSVRLYRALEFPERWVCVGTLLQGKHYVDPSIFQCHGKWWLYAETSPEVRHDTLRLYCADDITGPWTEHPRSPLIVGDAHTARPAGRVQVRGNQVIRYAQDCSPHYGSTVRAFEVTDLTPWSYREREARACPLLKGSGSGWNRSGMHHIDPHQVSEGLWLACVDGWSWIDAADAVLPNGTRRGAELAAGAAARTSAP